MARWRWALYWLWQRLVSIFSITPSTTERASLVQCIRRWVSQDYHIAIIEIRPGQPTLVRTFFDDTMEVVDTWSGAFAGEFIASVRDFLGQREITDMFCLAHFDDVEVDGVVVAIELDVLPKPPAGIDVIIYISALGVSGSDGSAFDQADKGSLNDELV